ncbi:MAG: hypothetical protein WCI01_07435 [Chlorobiaceae bacterium]
MSKVDGCAMGIVAESVGFALLRVSVVTVGVSRHLALRLPGCHAACRNAGKQRGQPSAASKNAIAVGGGIGSGGKSLLLCMAPVVYQ